MKKATTLFTVITLMIAVLVSCPSFGQMKMESEKTPSLGTTATLKTK